MQKPRKLVDFSELDPMTEQIIGSGRARQAARRGTKEERAARQAQIDRQRNRRMIDIDPELDEGFQHLTQDQLTQELIPGRSMRYANNLPLPKRRRRSFKNVPEF
jgi:hypothetical protein